MSVTELCKIGKTILTARPRSSAEGNPSVPKFLTACHHWTLSCTVRSTDTQSLPKNTNHTWCTRVSTELTTGTYPEIMRGGAHGSPVEELKQSRLSIHLCGSSSAVSASISTDVPKTAVAVKGQHKLQALVYDILPSTAAVFSYVTGSWKLSANEQFFVGAQTVVSLL